MRHFACEPRPTLWRERALCREVDPELFFPYSAATINARDALAVCERCPVRPECLAWVRSWPAVERDVGMVAGGVYWPHRSARVAA